MKVFDIHMHIFPEKIAEKAVKNLAQYYQVAMACKGTKEDFDETIENAEVIKKSLIFATATTPHQTESVNNFISNLISDDRYAFGSVHPGYDKIEEEIDRMISLGLRGIKLHSDFQGFDVDCKAAQRIYDYAQFKKLPIMFHAGDKNVDSSSPKRLRHIKDMFPDLTMICAHLGGYSVWDEVWDTLIGQDVYFDTSSTLWALEGKKAVEIIKAHGVDRCMFGTDYPMHYPKQCIKEILELGFSEEDNNRILWDNAVKFFEEHKI